ncbi:hypothetical protein EOM39_05915 [Candidatus Gracilibacteria bacterium]|nr:hypothetical protein [Candidatus Gracilibacteria bacterium]
MQDLAPLLGYYGFLITMFGLGFFFYYGMGYMKKKRDEKKEKELLSK